eukprot:gb/GFBE01059486.1/.p1 GENE.gb/GFBE01059486.1/~~gb/GFBE01059486.1/.p1  ORF type:complete len:144 (+),score=22.57 gb/GFBE01059486.1/:1-432(+)
MEWVAACWDKRNKGQCPRGGAPNCKRCSGVRGALPTGQPKSGPGFTNITVMDKKSGEKVDWVPACWDMRNTGECPRGGAPNCKRCSGDRGALPTPRGGSSSGKGGWGKGSSWGKGGDWGKGGYWGGSMVIQPQWQKSYKGGWW